MEGNGDGSSAHEEDEKPAGLTPQVLDYYKRFGRHRDLEQYFSLSTVQGDVRDPVFWRSIKSQPDSDSGKSSAEVCRISINCTVADLSSSSQDGSTIDLPEPNSPPIISEDAPPAATLSPLPEDDRELKSDLDTSHKSADLNLDSSLTKPHSPTSSINSQRKLEWDSLADVGYANENEIRPSASSLSTLERLALHQQFSLSDELKNDNISGNPTAHSTPQEGDNAQSKGKKNSRKGLLKQATKFSQRDVDVMEINVDRADNNVPANINFNLTKHISFNVDPETGAASLCTNKTTQKTDYSQKCATMTVDAAVGVSEPLDKGIQTTPSRSCSDRTQENVPKITPNLHSRCIATVPVLLNLDLLKRSRHRGLKYYRNKVKKKKRAAKQKQTKKEVAEQLEKSIPISEVTIGGNQLSEADSFEYMPAHVYHQNTARNNCDRGHVPATETSNKTSSSASSGGYTTQSSKFSEHSFTKDLEKSIALLNKLVQLRHEDAHLKKKLVKEVVQKLIKSNYRDDESATEFLSGLSFNSKILGIGIDSSSYHNTTTTSTSDGNDVHVRKNSRPRKSILRSPNSAKPVHPTMLSEHVVGKTIAQIHSPHHIVEDVPINPNSTSSSKTGSDKQSGHEKSNSEVHIPKTSSEQLYELYLKALLKEEKYKEHLNNKQEFLRPKLYQKKTDQEATSLKTSSLKDLMKDLTKNDDPNKGGDGDLPPDSVRSNPERNINNSPRKLRSHSVFTISSGNSERKLGDKCRIREEQKKSLTPESIKIQSVNIPSKSSDLKFNTLPRTNKNLHYCCCPHHNTKKGEIDNALNSKDALIAGGAKLSAIYSNDSKISTLSKENKITQTTTTNSTDKLATDLASCNKFVCFCNADGKILENIPDNFLIYKCGKLPQLAKSRNDVRVLKLPQSSRSNICLPRRFSDTLSERPKSTLCVDTYMQTSVSIDPKISEPTLADINVLHENNEGIETNSDISYNARYTPMHHCTNFSQGGVNMIDTNAKITIDKKPKHNQDPLSKRQTETNVTLDTNFHSEVSSAKSKLSSLQSDNEDMITYLNVKKSNAVNTANEGVNIGCIAQRDVDTSVTGLMKETSQIGNDDCPSKHSSIQDVEVTISHADVKIASSSRPSSQTSIGKSSKSTGVSAELTPRNGESLLKQQLNLKSPDSIRSAKSSKDEQDPKDDKISNPSRLITKIYEEKISRGKENVANVNFKNKRNKSECTIDHKSTEDNSSSSTMSKEVLLESIKDIIKRYAKEDKPVTIDKKTSRHKYYQEIINKLNYLLRTDGDTDTNEIASVESLKCDREVVRVATASKECTTDMEKKTTVDKSTQHRISSHQKIVCSSTSHHNRKVFLSEDSSDLLPSSDMHGNSSDSLRYQIYKKIEKECKKIHHKECQCANNFGKLYSGYDRASSSTSISCHKADELYNVHARCSHRCRNKNAKCSHNKVNKKSIAYNLIVQLSDSVIHNENVPERDKPALKDVVVKVPSRRSTMAEKTFQNNCSQHEPQTEFAEFLKSERSKPQKAHNRREKLFKENGNDKSDTKQTSLPDDSEISGCSDVRKIKFLTLREYLERNRPDFVSNSSERQSCLKVIQESRVRQQSVQRALLSLRVVPQVDVTPGSVAELEALARRLGEELRTRRPSAKFLSEHEMKRHSRSIYRSLPEVLQKKEKHKKDQIKKTNMIIRSLFNKNLQKKALRGTVNISHYSTVIKI